jgi:PAS domain S-box-containing protein
MSLASHTTPLIAALEQLGPHDHFCSIYESPQERYAVAIPFIRIGLERGEKCIYIADDGAVEDVRQAMQSDGIDVDGAIASKALVLATKDQTYLEHGAFNPDWMFTFWKETTELAMSDGFSALRATGETEWVLRGGRGLDRWMEYESRLNHTLSASKCSALCQYNRRLFPPELILDVIRTHPTIVYGSTVCRNLYYVPPEEFLGDDQPAREVERMLTNIRERERVDNVLREQLAERRRAEEELREQARLLDLTHDTVFSRRMDDEITYWNRGAEELYGWTREEAIGKVSHQLTQTIFPAPLEEINAELLGAGRWEGELVHTKRDGTQVVVASRWSLERDELGRPAAILETNNDITESKRAEEALRRSERYLAEAQRLSHTGSWALSANSKTAVYWSEEDFRIWGFDPRQGLPDTEMVFQRIHPEDVGRVYEKSMKALRERTDYTDEFRIVLPHEEVRHIHALAHPVLSASGEIAEYVGTHVDVTERKRAEEAQLRLAAIVASSDDAIISKTLGGVITTWNAGAQRTFGYAAEEAVGRPVTILIPPDRQDEESQIIERLRRGESVHHFETVRLRKDGRQIHVSLAISPIKDDAGQIIGASKIARDITERKRAAEALRQAQAYLAEAQRLSHTGSFGWRLFNGEIFWSEETYRLFQYDRTTKPTVELVLQRVHPEDAAFVRQTIERASQDGNNFDFEYRLLMPDGFVKHVHVVARALSDEAGGIEFVGAVMDVTEQRQAKAALEKAFDEIKKSEDRLRMVIDTIPGMVWSGLPDGTFDFVNQPWLKYLGCSWEELSARGGLRSVVHPDDVEGSDDRWETTRATGRHTDHELRMRRADGQYRWFLTRALPLRDEQGNIVQWYGTAIDIEDRKRTEMLLGGEKRLLEMIARGDSRALILDALCQLVEELAGGCLSSILLLDPNTNCLRHGSAPSLPTKYAEAIDGAAIGPSVGSCGTAAYRRETVIVSDIATDPLWADFRELALAHGLRACWSTPIVSSAGNVLGTFAIYYREPRSPNPQESTLIEQITHLASIAIERAQATQALQQQANLLEQAHDAILIWEFPRTIVYWNRGAEQLYGFSRKEAIGRSSHELLHTEHSQTMTKFEEALERDGEWTGELTHTTRDGRKIIVESRLVLMSETDGRRLVLETNRDITDRKRAEAELREAMAEFAHVSRVTTMGELTASLAHEVNQPITAAATNAKTCVRWLAGDAPNIEEARDAAMRSAQNVTRASEIISRIRLLFQKGAPEREMVDINEVVREIIVLLRSEATRYSISVRTELETGLPELTGDSVQLQQVFMNLLLNGIEAMKDGDDKRELFVKSQLAEDEQLLISISDTGGGLPPQANRIFDAFFTTKLHGTGMGLSISRSIVESHGGRLWADGNSPRGATFRITLPTRVEAH